jgi:hypothetical protein
LRCTSTQMPIDEGMSTLSSEYHVLSEPDASSHMNCDWGFDFDAFDSFHGEDALETPDIATETGTEAASLNPDVGVSSSALTPATPTERQSTHELGTGEKTAKLRGPEPIDTEYSPVSVTRHVVGADFANDMATGDKALDLTRDAPTEMSIGIDPQRAVVFDWNLSGTDPALSVFPNHDPDLGDSLALPPAGPTTFTTVGMQLPSQTSNGVGSAQSSPPNLPDDICQLIAKECLKQHSYTGPNTHSLLTLPGTLRRTTSTNTAITGNLLRLTARYLRMRHTNRRHNSQVTLMDPFSAFRIQRNWQALLCLLPFPKTFAQTVTSPPAFFRGTITSTSPKLRESWILEVPTSLTRIWRSLKLASMARYSAQHTIPML